MTAFPQPRPPRMDAARLAEACRAFLGAECGDRPTFGRVFGIPETTRDAAAIDAAWDARMRTVRRFQAGKQSALTQEFMNFLTQARLYWLARVRAGHAAGAERADAEPNVPASDPAEAETLLAPVVPQAMRPMNVVPQGVVPQAVVPQAVVPQAMRPMNVMPQAGQVAGPPGMREPWNPPAWSIAAWAFVAVLGILGIGWRLLPASTGAIDLVLDRPGAEIFVDGVPINTLPQAENGLRITLPAKGKRGYVISIRHDDTADFDHEWTPVAGRTDRLEVALRARTTDPPASAWVTKSAPAVPHATAEPAAGDEIARPARTAAPQPADTASPGADPETVAEAKSPGATAPVTAADAATPRPALLGIGQGDWLMDGDELVQMGGRFGCHLIFGDPTWTDCTLEVEAFKDCGLEGFILAFRALDASRFRQVVLGSDNNTGHTLQAVGSPGPAVRGRFVRPVESGRWQRLRLTVQGSRVRTWIDDVLVLDAEHDGPPQGAVGLGCWRTICRFRNLRVTRPDGRVLCAGFPDLAAAAKRSAPPVAEPMQPNEVDLLDLVTAEHDAPWGRWWFQGRDLRSPDRGEWAPLVVPYVPPAEYVLKATVERVRPGKSGLFVGLPQGGKHALLILDAESKGSRYCGLQSPPKPPDETFYAGRPEGEYLPCGRAIELECRVTHAGIQVLRDGRELVSRARGDGPTDPLGQLVGRSDVPFLGVFDGGSFRIRNLRLTEEGEPGRRVYPPNSEPIPLQWEVEFHTWPKQPVNFDWQRVFRSTPVVRTRLPVLKAHWCGIPPHPRLPADCWALKGTAEVELPAGRYQVLTESDDGIRVRIDGVVVVEEWSAHGELRRLAEADLPAGRHRIEVEYFQDVGWAALECTLRRAIPGPTPAPLAAVRPRDSWDHSSFAEIVAGFAPDLECRQSQFVALVPEYAGRSSVLKTHPPAPGRPSILAKTVAVPPKRRTRLILEVANHVEGTIFGDWRLVVRCNGESLRTAIVDGRVPPRAQWKRFEVDLSRYAGQRVRLELEGHATDWYYEYAYWGRIETVSD